MRLEKGELLVLHMMLLYILETHGQLTKAEGNLLYRVKMALKKAA